MPTRVVLLTLIFGLLASSWAANKLYDRKVSLAPYEAISPTSFYAGLDKFLSNISWMTLIQWQAAQQTMDPARADALYRKLHALTNLDPLFADAYLDGALALAPVKPKLAMQLLEKAILMGLDRLWKVHFYMALILITYENKFDQAVSHLEQAAELSDAPEYVQTMAIHARCRSVNDDPMQSLEIWYEFFNGLRPEQWVQRGVAVGQISEYADAVIIDCDAKLQNTTDARQRRELLNKRTRAEHILRDVGAAPSTQPSIESTV